LKINCKSDTVQVYIEDGSSLCLVWPVSFCFSFFYADCFVPCCEMFARYKTGLTGRNCFS